MKRRGLSLLEALVVLSITIIALLTALPIFYALLREQRGLAEEVLRGDTFPFLHARIDRDLDNASALEIGADPETKTVTLTFPPRDEESPTILWELSLTQLSRHEVLPHGRGESKPHKWKLDGALTLIPEEIAVGRLGLFWKPATGPSEAIVFEGPRPGLELK